MCVPNGNTSNPWKEDFNETRTHFGGGERSRGVAGRCLTTSIICNVMATPVDGRSTYEHPGYPSRSHFESDYPVVGYLCDGRQFRMLSEARRQQVISGVEAGSVGGRDVRVCVGKLIGRRRSRAHQK